MCWEVGFGQGKEPRGCGGAISHFLKVSCIPSPQTLYMPVGSCHAALLPHGNFSVSLHVVVAVLYTNIGLAACAVAPCHDRYLHHPHADADQLYFADGGPVQSPILLI